MFQFSAPHLPSFLSNPLIALYFSPMQTSRVGTSDIVYVFWPTISGEFSSLGIGRNLEATILKFTPTRAPKASLSPDQMTP